MGELGANEYEQWGQISNKRREVGLDVPSNRPGELLIERCCGCKVYACIQRKTIVLESKIC